MLVIDKPAGLAVHKGPKGGVSLEDDFDALRFGLPRNPALAHRLDRETAGCLVLGRHHKALEKLGLVVQAGPDRKDLLGDRRGRPRGSRGPDRPAARSARRDARLVDEGRSGRRAGPDAMDGRRARRNRRARDRLAGPAAADRAHPSIARSLRRRGLADSRRRVYGDAQRAGRGAGPRTAIARPARLRADREIRTAGGRRSAGAGAYAGRADRLRLYRRSAARAASSPRRRRRGPEPRAGRQRPPARRCQNASCTFIDCERSIANSNASVRAIEWQRRRDQRLDVNQTLVDQRRPPSRIRR